LLIGNEDVLQAFADEFRCELQRLQGERQREAGKLERELTEVERGIARCVDFIVSADNVPASVRQNDSGARRAQGRADSAASHVSLGGGTFCGRDPPERSRPLTPQGFRLG
jgi:hypothetical protein